MSAVALGPSNLQPRNQRFRIYTAHLIKRHTKCYNNGLLDNRLVINQQSHKFALSPLQNEWRVGLAVSWIVHVDGVARVSGKLAESSLAAAHALSQAATGACSPQGEGSMISMAYHQRVRTRDVSWGGRDVSWKKKKQNLHYTH